MGRTLFNEVEDADCVVVGILSEARLNPAAEIGQPDGSTKLRVTHTLKEHEAVHQRELTLARFIPPAEEEAVEFVLFLEIFDGQLDPYRGIPVEHRDFVTYLDGAIEAQANSAEERLAFFFGFLDHEEDNIAIDAYKHFAEASYDEEEVLMVELDRQHLEYARRLHFMYRDRRPETYGIISTHTDEITRG